MIEVLLVRPPLDLGEAAIGALLRGEAASERQRIDRLRRREDRVRSAVAHRLARSLVAGRLAVPLASVRLARGAHGRPFVEAPPGAGDVSLAHHGPWVAAAWTPGGRVGVDLVDPREVGPELAGAFCAAGEQALAAKASETDVLARLWGLKEAYLKLRGSGLSVDPRLVAFDMPLWRQGVYRLREAPAEPRFAVRALEDGALLAVGWEGRATRVRVTLVGWQALVAEQAVGAPWRRSVRRRPPRPGRRRVGTRPRRVAASGGHEGGYGAHG